MKSHTVHQLLLDVSIPSAVDSRRIDERLRDFAMGPLAQSLDSLEPNRSARLDRLEIDLGQIPLETFLRHGAKQIAEAVSKQIAQASQKAPQSDPFETASSRFPISPSRSGDDATATDVQLSSEQSASEADAPADALLSFLLTGHLPWWFPASRWKEATTPSRWLAPTRIAFFNVFLRTLQKKAHPALRLIRTLPTSELIVLLPEHSPSSSQSLAESEAAKRELLRNALTQLPAAQQPPSNVLDLLNPPSASSTFSQAWPPQSSSTSSLKTNDRNSPTCPIDPTTPDAPEDTREMAPTTPNGLSVRNAGLILLHPFLSRLFRSLDYLDENSQLLPETRWRAVQLLQYMTAGESGLPEHTLILEKTLCGIPLSEVAETPPLSKQEIDEADTLLQAAIDHWSALGKTSHEGLRQSFLLREGLLYVDDEPIRLQVEKQPYDMLLDRLPWQFRYVTFPWIRTPLLVQWR